MSGTLPHLMAQLTSVTALLLNELKLSGTLPAPLEWLGQTGAPLYCELKTLSLCRVLMLDAAPFAVEH